MDLVKKLMTERSKIIENLDVNAHDILDGFDLALKIMGIEVADVRDGIKVSKSYALTGPDNIVITKGSSKGMHILRKLRSTNIRKYTVWNAPSSKVGDKL
jgi:hypothetical protein